MSGILRVTDPATGRRVPVTAERCRTGWLPVIDGRPSGFPKPYRHEAYMTARNMVTGG